MAIFHLNISPAGAGAGAKQAYIEREGKYKDTDKYEDLKAHGSQNLPSWAKDSADFWQEDEKSESGNQYREIRLALPKELPADRQEEIVKEFCQENLADHALTWAIHENTGRLSGEKNPHAHIIFCERKIDLSRPEPGRDEYFQRTRRKDGQISGGYPKDREITGKDRKQWLRKIRKSAEEIMNRELQRAGINERVSCETLESQGIDRQASHHVGPRRTTQINQAREALEKKKEGYASKIQKLDEKERTAQRLREGIGAKRANFHIKRDRGMSR